MPHRGESVPDPYIATFIPAAGLSSRMSAFKPLVVSGQLLFEHVVRFFQRAGITEIIVTVGHR